MVLLLMLTTLTTLKNGILIGCAFSEEGNSERSDEMTQASIAQVLRSPLQLITNS